jgi:F-type H+-transporting ATPase subunit gamma
MANTREIKRRIRSVKNVAQITKAMEMVSASKMRRAQRNVLATRPYAERLLEVMGDLIKSLKEPSRRGTMLESRESVSRVGLLIITPDRGLCGSLVSNVLRRASRFVLEQQQAGREVDVLAIGKKGRDFMVRTGQHLVAEVTKIGDSPSLEDVLGVATQGIASFKAGEIDELHVVYSEFVNTLVQRAAMQRLLPIDPAIAEQQQVKTEFTYEPSAEEVLEGLLPRYAEVVIYQTLLESIASEHSARMVAMRNATKSAKDLQRDLTLSFNKARQSNITNEVSEIASGAAALGS